MTHAYIASAQTEKTVIYACMFYFHTNKLKFITKNWKLFKTEYLKQINTKWMSIPLYQGSTYYIHN